MTSVSMSTMNTSRRDGSSSRGSDGFSHQAGQLKAVIKIGWTRDTVYVDGHGAADFVALLRGVRDSNGGKDVFRLFKAPFAS